MKVLMVTTSHSKLGDTNEKTGVWLSELTHPYYLLKDGNTHIDIVSIKGGEIPIDPGSIAKDDEYNDTFLNSHDTANVLKNSKALADVNANEYDAIVFAGGHGTMWDFPDNDTIQDKILTISHNKGVIGAICHGVAALLGIKDQTGESIIKNKNVTGFSNEEEEAVKLTTIVPFSLENKLAEVAHYSNKPAWTSYAVSDANIITAQNPQSAKDFAQQIKKLLSQKKKK